MDSITPRPTQEELRLFSERIAHRLADRPLDLDPSSHQQRVAGLLRQAGEASFYQLLDVVPTATAQEVHEAYEQAARLVHPANARRLGLTGREGGARDALRADHPGLSQPLPAGAAQGLRPGADSGRAWSAAWKPAPGRRQDEARELAQQLLRAGADAGRGRRDSTSPSSCFSRPCASDDPAPTPRPARQAAGEEPPLAARLPRRTCSRRSAWDPRIRSCRPPLTRCCSASTPARL